VNELEDLHCTEIERVSGSMLDRRRALKKFPIQRGIGGRATLLEGDLSFQAEPDQAACCTCES
jgi:hypothetical protein